MIERMDAVKRMMLTILAGVVLGAGPAGAAHPHHDNPGQCMKKSPSVDVSTDRDARALVKSFCLMKKKADRVLSPLGR